MQNENIPDVTNPDANLEGASSGNTAVGGNAPQESIPLSELKSVLGKNWKDKDTALKSLKDMQSYTGKVGQLEKDLEALRNGQSGNAIPQINNEVLNRVNALENELWFEKNSQYKPMRPLVEKLAKAEGKGLHEVVELPEFKDTFTKVQGFEKTQNLRTVLETNPRLASSQDKMSKAQNLSATRSRKSMAEASELAVQAVIDANPDF